MVDPRPCFQESLRGRTRPQGRRIDWGISEAVAGWRAKKEWSCTGVAPASALHGGEHFASALDREWSDSDSEIRAGDEDPRWDRAPIRSAADGTRRRDRSSAGSAGSAGPRASGLVRAARHGRQRSASVRHRRAAGVCECSSLPWSARRRPRHTPCRAAREWDCAGAPGRMGEREGALAPTSVERQSRCRGPGGRSAPVGAMRAGVTIALGTWLRKTPSDRCSSRSSRR